MRPSWGIAALADVQIGHDLDAGNECVAEFVGRSHDLEKNPVYSVPDSHVSLERLEMDVARALPDGVGQDEVDQSDNRCLRTALLQFGQVHFRLFRGQIDLVFPVRSQLVIDFLQSDSLFGAVVFLDRFLDCALGRNHRFHVITGAELDLVQYCDVGRVGDRRGQDCPGPVQRQHLVSDRRFNRNQADDFGVNLELVKCHVRNVVQLAQDLGDRLVTDEIQVDQDVGQLSRRVPSGT